MILAFTEFKNPRTVDSVSAIVAGPAKAAILSAWVGGSVHSQAFAIATLSKAGEVNYAKYLVVLELEKIVPVTGTAIALHMNVHATLVGLDQNVMSQTALVLQIAITAAIVTLL